MKLKLNLPITLIVICLGLLLALTLGAAGQVLARRKAETPTRWAPPIVASIVPSRTPTPGWWADLPTPLPMLGTATASRTSAGPAASPSPYPTLPAYATWTPAH